MLSTPKYRNSIESPLAKRRTIVVSTPASELKLKLSPLKKTSPTILAFSRRGPALESRVKKITPTYAFHSEHSPLQQRQYSSQAQVTSCSSHAVQPWHGAEQAASTASVMLQHGSAAPTWLPAGRCPTRMPKTLHARHSSWRTPLQPTTNRSLQLRKLSRAISTRCY